MFLFPNTLLEIDPTSKRWVFRHSLTFRNETVCIPVRAWMVWALMLNSLSAFWPDWMVMRFFRRLHADSNQRPLMHARHPCWVHFWMCSRTHTHSQTHVPVISLECWNQRRVAPAFVYTLTSCSALLILQWWTLRSRCWRMRGPSKLMTR